jgi:cytochrome P450
MWAVTRYEDCLAVLKDPQRFSSQRLQKTTPPWLDLRAFGPSMITSDPPQHTKLRTLVSRSFGASALSRLEPLIRQKAQALAAHVADTRQVDFVSDFATPLPAFVIGELLGLDTALHARFKHWSDDLIGSSVSEQTPERIASIQRSFAEVERYLREVIEDRRRAPRDDMVSELVRAEVDGKSLSEGELLSFLALLLIAGLETTVHLLSNTLLTLSTRPEVFARVRAQPALVPPLIEEVLRFEPPVHGMIRYTTADVELSGVTLPKDALVIVLLGAAARDPRQFQDPDRFDIDRERLGNLPFGHGIHFCLGAALARLEARLGLEALFSQVKSFTRVESEPAQWNRALSVRGLTRLPLVFTPA